MNRDAVVRCIRQNGLPDSVKNSLLEELSKGEQISLCLKCGAVRPADVNVITHELCGGHVIRLGREISF